MDAGRRPVAALDRLPTVIAPDRQLLTYFTLQSLLLLPFFWGLLIPRFFR